MGPEGPKARCQDGLGGLCSAQKPCGAVGMGLELSDRVKESFQRIGIFAPTWNQLLPNKPGKMSTE